MKFFQLFILFTVIYLFSNEGAWSQQLPLESLLWESDTINVCWINPDSSNENERDWVELAVKRTWETESDLFFKGWCECEKFREHDNNGIRLKISENLTETTRIGKLVAHDSIAINFNFEFDNGVNLPKVEKEVDYSNPPDLFGRSPVNFRKISLNQIVPTNELGRRILVESLAVHEFGHVLGLSHEQVREDCFYGDDCFQEKKHLGYNLSLLVGCNERSVMNYCNDIYLNDGYLSAQDKELIQKIYGKGEEKVGKSKIELKYESKGKVFFAKNKEQQSQKQPILLKYKPRNIRISIENRSKKRILMVKYYFHQGTFNNQVVHPKKNENFSILLRRVWGSFIAQAKVFYDDGTEEILSKYINVTIGKKYGYGLFAPDKSISRN